MKVLFRTNATRKTGMGHLTRCLTLAAYLREYSSSIKFLLSENSSKEAEEKIKKNYELIKGDIRNSSEKHYDWVIVDSYDIDKDWELKAKNHTKNLMVIDDLGDREHTCDILLDQTHGVSKKKYFGKINGKTIYLLGSQYCLLPPVFLREKSSPPIEKEKDMIHLHLYFGTYDIDDLAIKYTLLILNNFTNIIIRVISKEDNKTKKRFEEINKKHPQRLVFLGKVENMAYQMKQCDIAFGAPGMATWERACLGLPSMYLACEDNQTSILEELKNNGFCEFLGHKEDVTAEYFIEKFSKFLNDHKKQRQLKDKNIIVDGRGGLRVAQIMANRIFPEKFAGKNLCLYSGNVKLVPYKDYHTPKTVQWLNNKDIQKSFGFHGKLSIEQHQEWLRKNNNIIFAILNEKLNYIGNIILTPKENLSSAYFQIYIGEAEERGKGYGKKVISTILHWAFYIVHISKIQLNVYPKNIVASKLYKDLGFRKVSSETKKLRNENYVEQDLLELHNFEWEIVSKK